MLWPELKYTIGHQRVHIAGASPSRITAHLVLSAGNTVALETPFASLCFCLFVCFRCFSFKDSFNNKENCQERF